MDYPESGRSQKIKQFLKKRGTCNLIIIAVNIVIFLWFSVAGGLTDMNFLAGHGAMYVPYIIYGQWWTLFTSMFVHFGIDHIAGNMLLLYFIGDNLERAVGSVKFFFIYIIGGLAGNLLSMGVEIYKEDFALSAGASGAVFAVIGALLLIVLRNHGRLEDLTTGRIVLMLAYTLYEGFTSTGVNNAAHIGGLIGGFIMALLLYRKKKHVKWNA